MRNGKLITPTALALVCAGGFAFAQNNPRAANPDTNKTQEQGQMTSNADRDAIKLLHQANQVEMEMGNIARTNAGSMGVKDYGRMLEQDHNKADKQLLNMAKQKQVQLTAAEPKGETKQLDELRQMKGQAFDKKFLQTMVEDHTKAIDDLQKLMPDVKDPQVKAMMQETLPTLKHHRDMAQSLLQKQSG